MTVVVQDHTRLDKSEVLSSNMGDVAEMAENIDMDLPTNKEIEPKFQTEKERRDPETIQNVFRPILVMLALCGCHDFTKLTYRSSSALKNYLSRAFRLFLFIVIILAVGKFVYAFSFITESEIILNGLYVTWLCLCTCNFLVHLKTTCNRFGLQEKCLKSFDEILDDFNQQGIEFSISKARTHTHVWTVVGCFLAMANILGIALQSTFHEESKAFYTTPFKPSPLSLSLFYFAEFALTLVWIFPWIYAIAMCDIIRQTFNSFNDFLKRMCCDNNCNLPKDIHRMRVLHLKLCDIVSNLDVDMRWYFASSCVFNLGLLCVTLYKLVKTPDIDNLSLILYIFWLSSALAILGLVTTFAALVNDRAHALLDTIYYIDVRDVSFDQVTQLNLFISKLTGTQVGFTTCGLLTITKEFILTIVGVFLTYFAVLYTL